MWISRTVYTTLLAELTAARRERDDLIRRHGSAAATAHHLAVAQQNIEWLTTHVNRLETERAQLLDRVLSIQMPVPTITYDRTSPETTSLNIPTLDRATKGVAAAAFEALTFEDVGDTRASELGITHAPDGALVYR